MNIIRTARIAKGLRLYQAATLLGTDPGNLSRVERGRQLPSVVLAKKLAGVYGMSLDQVFAQPPISGDAAEPSKAA